VRGFLLLFLTGLSIVAAADAVDRGSWWLLALCLMWMFLIFTAPPTFQEQDCRRANPPDPVVTQSPPPSEDVQR
jgi:hypothetical protein